MTKVKNISTGPRGIHLKSGELAMLEAGASDELDIADGEEPGEWFEFDGAAPKSESGDIAAAIDLLDADDDKHWTNAGLPAVDAISALVGRTVTRAEINEAAPDFMRPTE